MRRSAIAVMLIATVAACRPTDRTPATTARKQATEGQPSTEPAAARSVLQHGHTSAVEALAFSRDAKLLASGGADGKILIWDAAGRVLGGLQANSRAERLEFFGDGRRLLVFARHLEIWDLVQERLAQRLNLPQGVVPVAARLSPDDRSVGFVDAVGVSYLWRLGGTAKAVRLPQVPSIPYERRRAPSFSRDGTRMAVGNSVVDVASGTVVAEIPEQEGAIGAFTRDPNRVYLLKPQAIVEWDVRAAKAGVTHALPLGHDGRSLQVPGRASSKAVLDQLVLGDDERLLAIARAHSSAWLWRVGESVSRAFPSPRRTPVAVAGHGTSVATAAETRVILNALQDGGTSRILGAGASPSALDGHGTDVASRGARLAQVWTDHRLRYADSEVERSYFVTVLAADADLRVQQLIRGDREGNRLDPTRVRLVHGRDELVMFRGLDGIKVRDLNGGQWRRDPVLDSSDVELVRGAPLLFENRRARDGEECSLGIWDLSAEKRVPLTLGGPLRQDDLCGAAISDDGTRLAVATDKALVLWDVRANRQQFALAPLPRCTACDALGQSQRTTMFSPDGAHLVHRGFVWNLQQRKVVAELGFDVPAAFEASVRFSPGGRFAILSAPADLARGNTAEVRPLASVTDLAARERVKLPFRPELIETSADDKTLFALDASTIHVIDAATRTVEARLLRRSKSVDTTLGVAPDGRAFWERGDRGLFVTRRDPQSGWQSATTLRLSSTRPESLFWLSGGRALLAVSDRLRVYRVADGRALELLYLPPAAEAPQASLGSVLVLSDDGRFAGDTDALSALLSAERKSARAVEAYHPEPPEDAGALPISTFFSVNCADPLSLPVTTLPVS